MRNNFTIFLFLLLAGAVHAQSSWSTADVAQLISDHSKTLNDADVQNLRIDRQYVNDKGITFIYATQMVNQLPIHRAVTTIAISADQKTKVVNSKFIPNALGKIKDSGGVMDIELAVRQAFQYGDVNPAIKLKKESTRSARETARFSSDELTSDGARVAEVYTMKNGSLIRSWDVSYFHKRGTDFWSMRLDAATGVLIDKASFTTHCQFEGPGHDHNHGVACLSQERKVSVQQHTTQASQSSEAIGGDAVSYNVFALPVESPLHGGRSLLVDPSDSLASPFGWHDLDGVVGAETSITEGNNTNAWLDRDASFTADRDVESDGDNSFDFEYDGLLEPTGYEDASTTNLFYMVNVMHDFAYAYGMDEAAGNFQFLNYTGEGLGNDEVVALAQYDGIAGNNLNNADFSTPTDGGNGRMRMFLWTTRNDISVFTVTAPESVAGVYQSRTANFGPAIDTIPFIGEVAIADDGTGIVTDACEDITNGADITGKIAIIDRGDCEFGAKILNAERNGAIGVIICNNVSGILGGQMGGGAVGDQVTIPSVFITRADCARLRVEVGNGLEVNFQLPTEDNQPDRVDGSLDNGIVAHEFGHGISTRLTGGPDNSACLRNSALGTREEGEQMGEGWSDYFSLVMTVEEGDTGADPRGIGNYALRNPIDGSGIRAFPYSTDLGVNPVTYYDIYEASVPHGVGQVWCSFLWDMYWNFVDRYGWDPDPIRGTGGNNIAIQLVMDGMKIQPCGPGFVDGRDAILAADQMNNNGENQDLIWEAFARRGLGADASQGLSDLIADGKEDYTIPPQFIKTVKVAKDMTPVILKGEDIEVVLTVRNDMDENASSIQILDAVPTGAAFDGSSIEANVEFDITTSGSDIVITIAELAADSQAVISYNLETPAVPSRLLFYDDLESPDTDGTTWSTIANTNGNQFEWVDDDANSGTHAWRVSNTGDDTEQIVFTFFEVTVSGTNPMLRFASKYDTDEGSDGGVVEISTDFLTTTDDLGPFMFRNGYDRQVRESTFEDDVESAFTGSTDDVWEDTYVDLSAYNGQMPLFQWRFASDQVLSSDFWSIDDFTLFDAITYNSEVCVSFDGNTDNICAVAPERGTIVEPELISSTSNVATDGSALQVFPNPAFETINVQIDGMSGNTDLTVRDMQGRQLITNKIQDLQSSHEMILSINGWASGVYMVEVTNDDKTLTQKFIKK